MKSAKVIVERSEFMATVRVIGFKNILKWNELPKEYRQGKHFYVDTNNHILFLHGLEEKDMNVKVSSIMIGDLIEPDCWKAIEKFLRECKERLSQINKEIKEGAMKQAEIIVERSQIEKSVKVIAFKNILKVYELPEDYLRGKYFYAHPNNKTLYLSDFKELRNSVSVGDFLTFDCWTRLKKYLKECGERLTKINEEIKRESTCSLNLSWRFPHKTGVKELLPQTEVFII